jgi:hypothetical protein
VTDTVRNTDKDSDRERERERGCEENAVARQQSQETVRQHARDRVMRGNETTHKSVDKERQAARQRERECVCVRM